MSLLSEAREYAKAHPKPDKPGDAQDGITSWQDQCARLMFRFGDATSDNWAPSVTGPFSTHVRAASDMHTHDPDKVETGDYVWWNVPGDDRGHVGQVVKGSGRSARVFMASGIVTTAWATAIGVMQLQEYTDAKNATFKGASKDYAGAKISNLAALAAAPFVPLFRQEQSEVIRFKARHYYVASVNDIERISREEAAALNQAFDGVPFPPISSSRARLIIDGARRRKLRWMSDQAKAVGLGAAEASANMSDVEAEFDDLQQNEDGFTEEQAAEERGANDIANAGRIG